jgi:hypothetical protein
MTVSPTPSPKLLTFWEYRERSLTSLPPEVRFPLSAWGRRIVVPKANLQALLDLPARVVEV